MQLFPISSRLAIKIAAAKPFSNVHPVFDIAINQYINQL